VRLRAFPNITCNRLGPRGMTKHCYRGLQRRTQQEPQDGGSREDCISSTQTSNSVPLSPPPPAQTNSRKSREGAPPMSPPPKKMARMENSHQHMGISDLTTVSSQQQTVGCDSHPHIQHYSEAEPIDVPRRIFSKEQGRRLYTQPQLASVSDSLLHYLRESSARETVPVEHPREESSSFIGDSFYLTAAEPALSINVDQSRQWTNPSCPNPGTTLFSPPSAQLFPHHSYFGSHLPQCTVYLSPAVHPSNDILGGPFFGSYEGTAPTMGLPRHALGIELCRHDNPEPFNLTWSHTS